LRSHAQPPATFRRNSGVWLAGGRQWRLADAYLGTLTLKEMFNLLDRGGTGDFPTFKFVVCF
jgi:hypothetical protein